MTLHDDADAVLSEALAEPAAEDVGEQSDGPSMFGPVMVGLAVESVTTYTAWLADRGIRIDGELMNEFLREAGLVE